MEALTEGTTPGFLLASADLVRPQTRMGGSRNRALSNHFSCTTRATNTPSGEVRISLSVDVAAAATTSPTGIPFSDVLSPRPAFNDSLSAIGLPGEESATFIPLIIEPYEPDLSNAATPVQDRTNTAQTLTLNVEPPPSPLTPPTASPFLSNCQSSPTAAVNAATSPSMSTVSVTAITPRPPPGSAVQRVHSCRRNLVRQTSNASTCGGSAAAGTPATAPSPAAAVTATLPTAPRTPVAAAVDVHVTMPPSPALSMGEVPIGLFDSTAPIPAAGGGSCGDGSKAASSFLDPSKPAIRRLLPPLLRASQALQDTATTDGPTALADDNIGTAGCSPSQLNSWCSSGLTVGCSAAVSPPGGAISISGTGGGLEVWSELQDAPITAPMAVAALTDSLPLSPPPPLQLNMDVHDIPSPRGRRALPPMDSLRMSMRSTASALETTELEPSIVELVPSLLETCSTMSSPRPVSSSNARRGIQLKSPRDTEGLRDGREPRMWGVATVDTCDTAHSVGSGGDATAMLVRRSMSMQQTSSFHAAGGSSGSSSSNYKGRKSSSGGVGGGGNGAGAGTTMACNSVGQTPLDVHRFRVWTSATPETSLTALPISGISSAGGSAIGSSSSIGGGMPSSKERCRLQRANSVGMSTPRGLAPPAATTAPLPPIVDRGGPDRHQTSTC